VAPGRGDVSRADRGERARRQTVRAAAAPVLPGAVVGRARARAGLGPAPHRPVGRRAEPARPAVGLPVPPALSQGDRALLGRASTAARGRAESLLGLSPGAVLSRHWRSPKTMRVEYAFDLSTVDIPYFSVESMEGPEKLFRLVTLVMN